MNNYESWFRTSTSTKKVPGHAPHPWQTELATSTRCSNRLALTAAGCIGIAIYQTALPGETQLRRRLEQFPQLPEHDQ